MWFRVVAILTTLSALSLEACFRQTGEAASTDIVINIQMDFPFINVTDLVNINS